MKKLLITLLLLSFTPPLWAAEHAFIDLTHHPVGYIAIAIFLLGYILVILEEITALRKSKPMMLAAGLIWIMIAFIYSRYGEMAPVNEGLRHILLDYGELLLFLIVSITYLNAMEDRYVFESVRAWLISKGFGYRQLFWITGFLAFFISSVNNNMTTAMLMIAVVMAVGKDSPRFITLCCINTVVAVNAGGAFSPFGDITTLIVWQQNKVEFVQFLHLFLPSVVNYVLPAALMHFAIPKGQPHPLTETFPLQRGAKTIVVLYLATIVTSALLSSFWDVPPVFGMMVGLTYLQFYSYYLQITHRPGTDSSLENCMESATAASYDEQEQQTGTATEFDVFHKIAKVEWDTLLFFYGVMLSVGGLKFIGYLDHVAAFLYGTTVTPTVANTLVGVVSAFIDNSTVMFAILSMNPELSLGQWLLVTLTAGVGGSLLSFGSAAGVALMGQSKGLYNFVQHLIWMPAIAVGFAGSIAVHLWLNHNLF